MSDGYFRACYLLSNKKYIHETKKDQLALAADVAADVSNRETCHISFRSQCW